MLIHERIFKTIRVSFVSTYLPRRCGIATFTYDLVNWVAEILGESSVESSLLQILAINDTPTGYKYGPEVRFEIREQQKLDYREAADFLNISQTDIVCVQHEFGIYGGKNGSYLLTLLGNLKKPVVTSLHTVLQNPSPDEARVLKQVCNYSTLVVVQAQKAVELLTNVYGVPREKIVFIYHGAPDVPFLDPAYYKDQFQVEGRRVILTFGLLSPNKGIEFVIEAMAKVVAEFPDVVYIVLGATHPNVKLHWGEAYRLSLERLVKEKKLTEHVIFHNRFVSPEELIKFLIMSDIYVTPYLAKEQIVSGTLTYAVACGKAIISTPYWYAEELLADQRGILVPFRDSDALAKKISFLLEDETERNRLRKRAYQFGRQMIWREVATTYTETFERALKIYGQMGMPALVRRRVIPQFSLPEVRLNYLKLLTDNTGIIQHTIFTIPNRFHGYCTDDNARAALVAAMNWHLFKDTDIIPLLHTYLSFLHHAFDEEKRWFRNFMSYERNWMEEVGSEDCHGRALWALGTTVEYATDEKILAFATRMFEQALETCESFTAPRPWAYSILGCITYLRRFGGASDARRCAEILTHRLMELFSANCSNEWPWCEDILTYDNARLPQALIVAGQWLKDDKILEQGLHSLNWLLQIQTDPHDHHLSLIGNQGWFPRGGKKAQFDQQPIEAAALVDACYEAYSVTQQKEWFNKIYRCFNWFLGENDVHQPVYDFTTMGCHDGIHSSGVNQNQGAESTLAWLAALHRMHELNQENILYGTEPSSNVS
ncbi:hypothetical protein B5M50_06815 [candidate division KSB1 bacterium 4484_219]|nr:MAG: hypothetical protein B5M50_06815 [candidate division KSB1 bacterium 4484_219]